MKCYQNFCIHHQDYACLLDEVVIDDVGMCYSREFVYIPKEELEVYKAMWRAKLASCCSMQDKQEMKKELEQYMR